MASSTPTILSDVVVTAAKKRANKLRCPRSRILINGVELPTLKSGSVTRTTNYTADSFELQFALWANNTFDLDWWFGQSSIDIEVQAGNEVDGTVAWQSVLTGKVDGLDFDLTGGELTIHGRDKTALLIDNKSYQAYPNKTPLEIVQLLAASHGLTVDSDPVPTGKLAGAFYSDDHVQITAGQFSKARSEWDLITFLARKINFDAWVTGDVLHFKSDEPDDSAPWIIKWSPPTALAKGKNLHAPASITSLKLHRSLALAKDIVVTVRSWHPKLGKAHEATRTRAAKKPLPGHNVNVGGGAPKADISHYVFVIPNLTPEQCEDRAEQIAMELTKREIIIDWQEPGDFRLVPRRELVITGAPKSIDQTYYVEEIKFDFGFDGGFTMTGRAKNHVQASEITV